jgi:hypothetical protein
MGLFDSVSSAFSSVTGAVGGLFGSKTVPPQPPNQGNTVVVPMNSRNNPLKKPIEVTVHPSNAIVIPVKPEGASGGGRRRRSMKKRGKKSRSRKSRRRQ